MGITAEPVKDRQTKKKTKQKPAFKNHHLQRVMQQPVLLKHYMWQDSSHKPETFKNLSYLTENIQRFHFKE